MTFPALSLWQFSKSSQHRIWHTVSTQYKHPIVSLLLLLLLSIWLLCSVCSGAPQSCLTLCNSSDCSPPGSSVHGVFFSGKNTAVGLPFPPPGNLPNPGIKPSLLRLLQWQADSLPAEPSKKPIWLLGCPWHRDPWVGWKIISRHGAEWEENKVRCGALWP